MINSNLRTNKGGFTIVETLVAISVLMIAIAGPLVVASRGLFDANLSRDQFVATYLAQESIESVKNIRDNNIYNGSSWVSGLSSCTQASPCDASALDGVSHNPSITTCIGEPCRIYRETNGFGHVASGATASIFTRQFYLHDPTSVAACSSDDECGVTVEVRWSEGQILYDVILTSQITSTIR